jgi:hypothetical protein
MFQAILHGKLRDNLPGLQVGTEWRTIYRRSEDFLVASVFTRLSYVEPQAIRGILRRAVPRNTPTDQQFPEDWGELRAREFWPRWALDTPGSPAVHKEPDVFLGFERLHLIIEAKADDTPNQQSPGQWAAEVASCLQRDDLDTSTPLWLLAIGGLGEDPSQSLLETMHGEAERLLRQEYAFHEESIFLAACSWRQLAAAVLEEARAAGCRTNARLLEDIVEIMRFHGFRHVCWLSELRGLRLRPIFSLATTSFAVINEWGGRAVRGKAKHLPWYVSLGLVGIREETMNTLGGMADAGEKRD